MAAAHMTAVQEIAGSHTANGHSVPLPEVQELDLNSLESVRSFSSRITSQHEQPSLVICNAGAHTSADVCALCSTMPQCQCPQVLELQQAEPAEQVSWRQRSV